MIRRWGYIKHTAYIFTVRAQYEWLYDSVVKIRAYCSPASNVSGPVPASTDKVYAFKRCRDRGFTVFQLQNLRSE